MTKSHSINLVIEHDDDAFFDVVLPNLFRSIRDNGVLLSVDRWHHEELTITLIGKTKDVKKAIVESFDEQDAIDIIDTMIAR
jgi:hypothetical protein